MDGVTIDGWKTYLAGAMAIMAGIVGLYYHFKQPDSPLALQPEIAFQMIAGGLGIIGLGHKLDKNTAAVKEAAVVNATATADAGTKTANATAAAVNTAATMNKG